MKNLGFNHFQLDSNDMEKTRAFYESLGGTVTQVMTREGDWKGYHIRLCDGVTVEVQPPRLPEMCGGWNGWDHVAIEVDCAEVVAERIEALGGRIEKRPSPNHLGDLPVFNSVVYGVDGEKIELIQIDEVPGSDRIIRLSHVQLNSGDVEVSKKFYEDALGARELYPIYEKDGVTVKGHMMEIVPGSVLEIQPPRFPFNGKTSAWNTIALEFDDINEADKCIVAAGGIHEVGPFKGTMGTINIYNIVDIGPDGEHFELIQIID